MLAEGVDSTRSMQDDILQVLGWVFMGVGAIMVPFALYLGFKFMSATDANKRKDALKHFVNVLVSLVIIIVLITFLVVWGGFTIVPQTRTDPSEPGLPDEWVCPVNPDLPCDCWDFQHSTSLAAAIQPWIGTRYVWGGNTKQGVDCSGFVRAVLNPLSPYNIPRYSGDQGRTGTSVATHANILTTYRNIRQGDILWFSGHTEIVWEVRWVGTELWMHTVGSATGGTGRVYPRGAGQSFHGVAFRWFRLFPSGSGMGASAIQRGFDVRRVLP